MRIAQPTVTNTVLRPIVYAMSETRSLTRSIVGVRVATKARTMLSSVVNGQKFTSTCVTRNPRPIIPAVNTASGKIALVTIVESRRTRSVVISHLDPARMRVPCGNYYLVNHLKK